MSAELALRRMLLTHLRADAALVALTGTIKVNNRDVPKIFDEPPAAARGLDAPYIEFSTSDARPAQTGCGAMMEVSLQINCWSKASGRSEALRIRDRVADLLGFDDDAQPRLSAEGFALEDIRIERLVMLDDEDGEHRNGIIQLIALVRRGI